MLLRSNDFRRRAQKRLPRFVFDYVDGGAEDERCLGRNQVALEAITLVPRVLRDTRVVQTSTDVFGKTWSLPMGIAPIGFAGLVRPQGDVLMARAAAAHGVPFVLSTASNSRLEAVREAAPHGVLWMQLYVMSDRAIAQQILRRARAANFDALVLTVDVPVSGMRERDARNGFKLPFRPRLSTALDLISHPLWSLAAARSGAPAFANLVEDPDAPASPQVQAALLARSMDRSLTWDSLAWLRRHWEGPLLVKGVLSAADAREAVGHGVDGLIVSNHGGRQLDVAPATIAALPRIVDAVGGRLPVFVDGGFRRGSDVAKAVALGARGVFMGRAPIWGLAAGGQAGVEDVLALAKSEFERTLILLGATRVADLHGGELLYGGSAGERNV
ncbi:MULTISPECIES: alpha-hydroxy acid oxidase [Variovorax]|jgi:(S)-mandelate dehydrogenase|uniref:alpha-hydroxy acid oxidase n=1 Tax=Variovorax TaxID=34072 RepID=UPI000868E03B|nr:MULTISPECIES: alpha-hydroxy acid oxidase [Variovorax]MBN8754561.1 alpha-hydroxy-acid oxidizing protein [Variovorax sp.]ODU19289.1 MAG: alpha-hydroxy-acid oxidizing enzyme [Variovorax sp. SCN 67-85]ODV25192.1 MAG: alpha-hydroxy-acid oxidizing enzyme [Variovorax sp. SCN 67-20]OJZ03010.1 MAG: alpha-hydroxy-acid oxidizing enzyme [Variovorax sp. 67-131]UKI07522.1 alpha-hydroxy-acid oxidizing protein [Variovorax paradoxus]